MSIRVVDHKCRYCDRPLTDDLSRRRRVGPDCWRDLTPEEQAAALELAAAERDPFRIPEERAPSATARVNHRNVRAALAGDVQVCVRHGGALGRCPLCEWESKAENAAALILREVRSWTFAERRDERLRVLAARYELVTPWRAPERPKKPRETPPPARDRQQPPARPTGQLELL